MSASLPPTPHSPNALSRQTCALHLAQKRYAQRQQTHSNAFLSLKQLSPAQAKELVQTGLAMKAKPEAYSTLLAHKSVALLFQKTSTRTRCSFENAAVELGAYPSYIDWRSSNFTLADLQDEIHVLSRYYDLIVARVLAHRTLEIMAEHSETPVINGMCDRQHPCQALSDFLTLTEYFGSDLSGLRLAYIGDGNNVCRSLVHAAALFGANIALCSPAEYALDPETLNAYQGCARSVADPYDAICDADAIYTDTWISIGQESESQERLAAFQNYQVNQALLDAAPQHALFMHCLPAHPGQEVTPGVLRGPRSIVIDQAENRKHAQKALLSWLTQ